MATYFVAGGTSSKNEIETINGFDNLWRRTRAAVLAEKKLMTQSLFLRLKAAVIQHFMLDSAEREVCTAAADTHTKKVGTEIFTPII